jgi:hypothetical protein
VLNTPKNARETFSPSHSPILLGMVGHPDDDILNQVVHSRHPVQCRQGLARRVHHGLPPVERCVQHGRDSSVFCRSIKKSVRPWVGFGVHHVRPGGAVGRMSP